MTKIPLSTLFFLVTIGVLFLGWGFDRRHRVLENEAIAKRERIYAKTLAAHQYGSKYFSFKVDDFEQQMKIEMVEALRLLWQEEVIYRQSELGRDLYPAERMANSFLEMLDCHSPESFREFSLSIYRFKSDDEQAKYRKLNDISVFGSGRGIPEPNEHHYPEFHDEQSQEFNSFNEFLVRALQTRTRRGAKYR